MGAGADATDPPRGDDAADVASLLASRTDPRRFADLFDRHYAAVARYLRRRLDGDDADGLASETFVRAFAARGRYDPANGTPRAWLYGIATNLLRQHWRTETRRLRAYARAAAAGATPAADDPDGRLDAQRLHGALADALASLPKRDRDVLLLHAWADLSHAEIAAALGIPDGTVRSRLSRARAHVRERIPAIGEDTHDRSVGGEPD